MVKGNRTSIGWEWTGTPTSHHITSLPFIYSSHPPSFPMPLHPCIHRTNIGKEWVGMHLSHHITSLIYLSSHPPSIPMLTTSMHPSHHIKSHPSHLFIPSIHMPYPSMHSPILLVSFIPSLPTPCIYQSISQFHSFISCIPQLILCYWVSKEFFLFLSCFVSKMRKEADDIGPMAELEHWKKRMAKFNV